MGSLGVGSSLEDHPMKVIKTIARIVGYGFVGAAVFVLNVILFAAYLWAQGGWSV